MSFVMKLRVKDDIIAFLALESPQILMNILHMSLLQLQAFQSLLANWAVQVGPHQLAGAGLAPLDDLGRLLIGMRKAADGAHHRCLLLVKRLKVALFRLQR